MSVPVFPRPTPRCIKHVPTQCVHYDILHEERSHSHFTDKETKAKDDGDIVCLPTFVNCLCGKKKSCWLRKGVSPLFISYNLSLLLIPLSTARSKAVYGFCMTLGKLKESLVEKLLGSLWANSKLSQKPSYVAGLEWLHRYHTYEVTMARGEFINRRVCPDHSVDSLQKR